MTISIGWWIVPAVITLAALVWARREDRKARRNAFGYSLAGAAGVAAIAYLAAVVVALIAWLAWALA